MESNQVKMLRLNAATILLIAALLLLLSLVTVTSPELSADETAGQWLWFDRTAIGTAVLILLVIIMLWKKNNLPEFGYCLSLALMIWGGIEAVYGLRQLYGFAASGHARYALTGSFFNPGPYAGYLAMVLPVCLHRGMELRLSWKHLEIGKKIEKCIAIGAGMCILCVLPATMSRSAWLAAGVSCLWMYGNRQSWALYWTEKWEQCRKHLVMVIIGVFSVLVLVVGALFLLKPDSAKGRLFMWKITCQAIAEKPLTGHGAGNFAMAYGDVQEKYFAKGDYEEWEERVAGSPEYAFNEYLQIAAEYGIPVAAFTLSVVGFCIYMGIRKERIGICGAILSLLIFSFSSYPLQLPVFIVTFSGLLLSCVVGNGRISWGFIAIVLAAYGLYRLSSDSKVLKACREEMNVRILYRAGAYEAALEDYERLYPLLKRKGDFLFEYGHSLHRTGKFTKSSQVLKEAMQRSNDPMILNIIGKNCQQTGDYWAAEDWFMRAVHRLPGRIYPYYLLAKLYAEPGYSQPDKFEEMKRIVLTKEPKVNSTAIKEMREELNDINIVSQ